MTQAGQQEAAPRLLEGMRVLSFCHYLQGPAATQYLADMGADVITVEPLGGAFERHWAGASTYVAGTSAFFLSANRNKRSLAIDLKHPDAAEIIRRLIASADVLVENYRPGVMERLGLGYEQVRAMRPDILYASATGFGGDGPLRDRPGQDLLIQARTGLVATTGSQPTAVGSAIVDQHGAALLVVGILGAYIRRLKSGEGTRIEASLYNAGIDLQTEALTLYYSGKHGRDRLTRQQNLGSWYHEAPYGVYPIADGWMAISLNPVARLAKALESEALTEMAAGNAYLERDAVGTLVAELLADKSFAALAACFEREGVWHEKVRDYDDLREDPQAVHNGVFLQIPVGDEFATIVNHPLRYNGKTPALTRLPPEIGEHSSEILKSLAFSPAEIAALVAAKVVIGAERQEEAMQ